MHRVSPFVVALASALLLGLGAPAARAKTIGVFVALADNASQGLVPVPAAIGDGNDPERNLYWGTAEGLKGVFDKSNAWKLLGKNDGPASPDLLRIRVYQHQKSGATLKAMAYRGSSIQRCLQDFEAAIQSGGFDLVVFIGHNGLMDFQLPVPRPPAPPRIVPDCAVLCCKSEIFFKDRITAAGGRPVLLTTQLMYPGAFVLHDVAEGWLAGASVADIRRMAGDAYAKNQGLSKKAGLGVFADLPVSTAP